ncbi:MAG: response regulator [Candidatus Didemnitutus sp.]|nr:response regulator [Candidatus Didemnitutus sp.]
MNTPANATAPTELTQAQLNPRQCIILIDDESAYLDLLEQFLGLHFDCPIHSFNHAATALEALPSLNVGLVVTDYQMPEIDGLQLLDAVSARLPDVPAIMITAHEIELTPEVSRRYPALKKIVRKPFQWSPLAEEIGRHWRDRPKSPTA